MRLLAIDIGSSSVKSAVLRGGRAVASSRVAFKTRHAEADGLPRAEVKLAAIERAVRTAVADLGPAARGVDLVVPTTMAPSWLAMDARGRALTAVVTHQDRRSIDAAAELERRVGRARHLRLAGNRPFPGGISSTTCAWHLAREPDAMRRAATVGHLGTWLALALTGERIIDLSNAGFTGLLDVRTAAWSDELTDAVGLDRTLLPRIVASDAIVGTVAPGGGRRFGIDAGTPLLAGCIDGSAAMLAAGARVGQLVNVCGSTDVLALCTRGPMPHAELLTRPLGVDGKWLSVATIAAAGSAIEWAAKTLFGEMPPEAFHRHVRRVTRAGASTVGFDAALAGSRTAMGATRATIGGLTLSSTRDDVLRALVDDLARRSAGRLSCFDALGLSMRREVFSTGGGASLAAGVLRAGWPKRFRFREAREATLGGCWTLAERLHSLSQ